MALLALLAIAAAVAIRDRPLPWISLPLLMVFVTASGLATARLRR